MIGRGGGPGRVCQGAPTAPEPDERFEPGAPPGAPDFKTSWPVHCVAGTPGSDFHPNFLPAVEAGAIDAVFYKGAYAAAYSGFEGAGEDGMGLATWLRAQDVTAVDVIGIATDHCVKATALDAASAGLATQVLLDLTAGVSHGTILQACEEFRQAGVELSGAPVVAGA
ncbi:isochorismatase hydrolase [Actinobacteria bacterium OV450]|nr:isochorismatase hydrolase [Actinobacteria bacterium OV450]